MLLHGIWPNPRASLALWHAVGSNPAHPIVALHGPARAPRVRFRFSVLLLFDREIGYDVEEIILVVKGSENHQRIQVPIFKRSPRRDMPQIAFVTAEIAQPLFGVGNRLLGCDSLRYSGAGRNSSRPRCAEFQPHGRRIFRDRPVN